MAKVSASIKNEPYRIEIKSPTGNVLIADEPIDKGGKDSGFSPKELLGAALAACTSATVRMYAEKREWPLDEVKIAVDLERNESGNSTVFNKRIEFIGNLTGEQRKRLLAVANVCPVHKILTNPIEIITSVQ
jgi:putative redox protein